MTSLPEIRLNTEFINGLNETTDIVTQNLTQRFVHLRLIAFASQVRAELDVQIRY